MTTRRLFAVVFALVFLGAGFAEAAPKIGTAKARGDYRGFSAGGGQTRMVRSRQAFQYRAPAVSQAPAIVATPAAAAPAVAQAPSDSRRFSYAPAADAGGVAAANPCAPAGVVPQAGRRYSYAPSEAGVAPTVPVQRIYSGNYGSSRVRAQSSTKPAWALQKTDPAKYRSR